MNFSQEDISDKVGPLLQETEKADWPMYSYHYPARAFWQGMFRGLRDAGLPKSEVKDILQSKLMRWAFDGDAHDVVEQLAYNYARDHAKEWHKDIRRPL